MRLNHVVLATAVALVSSHEGFVTALYSDTLQSDDTDVHQLDTKNTYSFESETATNPSSSKTKFVPVGPALIDENDKADTSLNGLHQSSMQTSNDESSPEPLSDDNTNDNSKGLMGTTEADPESDPKPVSDDNTNDNSKGLMGTTEADPESDPEPLSNDKPDSGFVSFLDDLLSDTNGTNPSPGISNASTPGNFKEKLMNKSSDVLQLNSNSTLESLSDNKSSSGFVSFLDELMSDDNEKNSTGSSNENDMNTPKTPDVANQMTGDVTAPPETTPGPGSDMTAPKTPDVANQMIGVVTETTPGTGPSTNASPPTEQPQAESKPRCNHWYSGFVSLVSTTLGSGDMACP